MVVATYRKGRKIRDENKIKTRQALTEGACIKDRGIVDNDEATETAMTMKVKVVVEDRNK